MIYIKLCGSLLSLATIPEHTGTLLTHSLYKTNCIHCWSQNHLCGAHCNIRDSLECQHDLLDEKHRYYFGQKVRTLTFGTESQSLKNVKAHPFQSCQSLFYPYPIPYIVCQSCKQPSHLLPAYPVDAAPPQIHSGQREVAQVRRGQALDEILETTATRLRQGWLGVQNVEMETYDGYVMVIIKILNYGYILVVVMVIS